MEVQPDSISGAVPEIRFLVQLGGDHNAGKVGDPDTAHHESLSDTLLRLSCLIEDLPILQKTRYT
jgi:hypothetical protein